MQSSAAFVEGGCRTVLIVDDDDDVRQLIKDILEEEGYDVLVARHGGDALAQLRTKKPAPCVILLDLMMPVMDGWEFLAEQHTDASLKAIPIVLFSADRSMNERAAALGAAGVLSKPVHLEDLLRVVEEHCSA